MYSPRRNSPRRKKAERGRWKKAGKEKRDWKQKLYKQQAGLCYWCKKPMAPPRTKFPKSEDWRVQPTFEHVVRLADGGTWAKDNVVLAHAFCNHTRHQYYLTGWEKFKKTATWFWKFRYRPVVWWWLYKNIWRWHFPHYPPEYIVNRQDKNRDFVRELRKK